MSEYREFYKESPDYNHIIFQGNPDRIAANRTVLCIMTEFGLMNNRKMRSYEYSRFIENIQITSGKFEPVGEQKVFIKTIPLCFTSVTYPNEIYIECTA